MWTGVSGAAFLALLVAPSGAAQTFLSKQPARVSITIDAPAPGQLELPVRITPNPGIHVYAPGNPDYIPVTIELVPPRGWRADPARFPKAEDLFFPALGESLKIYSKPFVVTVPIRAASAGSAAASTTIALTGVLKYQACDDRVCFPPQSAPFEARLPVAAKRR